MKKAMSLLFLRGLFSIPWRIVSRFLDMTSKPFIACLLLLLFPVSLQPQCNSDVLYFTTVSLICQLFFFIHLSHHDVFLNVLKIRHFLTLDPQWLK